MREVVAVGAEVVVDALDFGIDKIGGARIHRRLAVVGKKQEGGSRGF